MIGIFYFAKNSGHWLLKLFIIDLSASQFTENAMILESFWHKIEDKIGSSYR